MNNILLIDAQSVQAISVAKFLKKKKENSIYGFFQNKLNYSFYTNLFNKKVVSPKSSESKKFLNFLIDFLIINKVHVIIPLNDISAQIVSRNKNLIGKYSSVLISDFNNFNRGFDKSSLMKLCKEINVSHPDTISLSSKNYKNLFQNISFPVLVKPNALTGSRGITKINDYAELLQNLDYLSKEEIKNYHIQQYLNNCNNQLKVQILVDNNTNLIASSVMLKKRYYPVNGGSSTFNVTIKNKKVVNDCFKVLKKLNWVGFADFDLISDNKGDYKIIEINPRIPACIKSALVSGINYPQLIVDLSLQKKIKPIVYLPGKALKHIGLDFLWLLKSKEKGKFIRYFRDFYDKNVYYQEYYSLVSFLIGTFGNILNFIDNKFMKNKKW